MSIDLKKYQTQVNVPEIGMKGQTAIANAKIIVIGAGGLGCPSLQLLGGLGVSKIGIVDFDTVSIKNLHRQLLYNEEEVGLSKVEMAKIKLTRQNLSVEIETFNVKLSTDNAADIIHHYDIIMDCCDNYETRYVIDSTCHLLNKPWVYAAVNGFEGQVSVFNYLKKVRYSHLYSDKRIFESIAGCDVQGVTASTCGFAANLQVNEAIKIILKREDVCEGELLAFNLLSLNLRKFKLHF